MIVLLGALGDREGRCLERVTGSPACSLGGGQYRDIVPVLLVRAQLLGNLLDALLIWRCVPKKSEVFHVCRKLIFCPITGYQYIAALSFIADFEEVNMFSAQLVS